MFFITVLQGRLTKIGWAVLMVTSGGAKTVLVAALGNQSPQDQRAAALANVIASHL